MTATHKNIDLSWTIVATLSSAFWLALPLKAQEAYQGIHLPQVPNDCQQSDRELTYQELEGGRVAQMQNSPPEDREAPLAKEDRSHATLQPKRSPVKVGEGDAKENGECGADRQTTAESSAQLPSFHPATSASALDGLQAQVPSPLQVPPIITPLPSPVPSVQPTPQPLPPPEQILQPSSPTTPAAPEASPGKLPGTITINEFKFEGNTAFSSKELAKVTQRFINHPITFAELLEARSAITQYYIDKGYVTSGALIPPQTLDAGVVTIQIVEGRLEDIRVNGLHRLNPNYVRSRVALGTQKPLNVPRLLETLRLLQLNPLIANLSAELSAGSQPGTSLLTLTVKEADTFNTQIIANNDRPPSIGSFRRGVQFTEANLLGLGDGLSFTYGNTDGSNDYNVSYTVPVNPRNGTLNFSYINTPSRVIEPPFDILNIRASSRYYDLTYRQPVSQTPSEEFALSLTLSRRESRTVFLGNNIDPEELPFPSPGADENGRTTVNALRFTQEYTKRGSQQVIAARSQFSFGLGILDSTVNSTSPDARFFSWRGQAQWVRLLAPDTLLLVRGDVQVANRPLLPIEQYGLGGRETLRGYRQDILLTDNGANLSAELRIPILRVPQWKTLLQIAPFIDLGSTWNSGSSPNPAPNSLASVGLGLQLQVSNNLTARFDYGIPLVHVKSGDRTWQENGLYFSIFWNPF